MKNLDQPKEFFSNALEGQYQAAIIKADPIQKFMINAELMKIKQNEEILEELRKLNSK